MPYRDVKADFNHLKKLFIIPENDDKFIEFGELMLDMIHNYFRERGGIHSSITLPELERMFSDVRIPREPHLLKDIFSEIREKIINHSVKVASPYYIGHMTSAIPYYSIFIEMIIAALNQNQVKIETAKASTFVERELLAWIHRLIYQYDDAYYASAIQDRHVALGNITLDGTLANLTALLIARNKLFPPDEGFSGVSEAGLVEAYRHFGVDRCVIFISQRGHYSIDKVNAILGIGRENIVKIPVDRHNKMDVNRLRKEIEEIEEHNRTHSQKTRIMAIVGIAGTTETGNIDDLEALSESAQRCGAHFHVDAAWGGPVLFVNQYRTLFKGIERADSVTFDSHKLLYLPLSMGMVLFRNKHDLDHIKHNAAYILRKNSYDLGRYSVEGSRPFAALRPWVAMKVFGSEGFRLLFENAFKLTAAFTEMIVQHDDFELLNIPELFITNYRYTPMELKNRINRILNEAEGNYSDAGIVEINRVLNEINKELHRALRQEDNSFVSRTLLESTPYQSQEVLSLRAVTINPLTDITILSEILSEQSRLGALIYKQFKDRNLI